MTTASLSPAQPSGPGYASVQSAAGRLALVAAESDPIAAAPSPDAAAAPQKRKAGFLAAAGLVILSLLVLATGLALVRAFRQR